MNIAILGSPAYHRGDIPIERHVDDAGGSKADTEDHTHTRGWNLGCVNISNVKGILRGFEPKMILNSDEVVIHTRIIWGIYRPKHPK